MTISQSEVVFRIMETYNGESFTLYSLTIRAISHRVHYFPTLYELKSRMVFLIRQGIVVTDGYCNHARGGRIRKYRLVGNGKASKKGR